MSDPLIPVDANFESSAVDQLVQTAWDRFAALGRSGTDKVERPDEVLDPSENDGDGDGDEFDGTV